MRDGTKLIVHLERLKNNISKLRSLAPKSHILFMVKANGYGHGLTEIVQFAFKEGIREFGCATIAEAEVLRKHLKEEEFEIYVFSDFDFNKKDHIEKILFQRIIPVIARKKDLKFFLEDKRFEYFPLCLKFNTGMNRLGIESDQLENIIALLKKHNRREVFHLMSHMACAADKIDGHQLNQSQIQCYQKIKTTLIEQGITIKYTSLSNSGMIQQGFGLEETHIRPGLMLYGPSALNFEDNTWNGEVVSSLVTSVIKTKRIKKNESIGYGAKKCPYDGVLAIVSLGYGDGLSTTYQGVKVQYKEYTGEIFGRVNMDMAQILFPENCSIAEGDTVQIWDRSQAHFRELAKKVGQIPYELFCQVSARVPRSYKLD